MDRVCADFETAPISTQEKALFRFLTQVNDAASGVSQPRVDEAVAAGWSEQAIYDAVTVCAIFNFFNRWVDGTGVPAEDSGHYEAHLETHGDLGYAP